MDGEGVKYSFLFTYSSHFKRSCYAMAKLSCLGDGENERVSIEEVSNSVSHLLSVDIFYSRVFGMRSKLIKKKKITIQTSTSTHNQ